jgi:hypothetical protein
VRRSLLITIVSPRSLEEKLHQSGLFYHREVSYLILLRMR